MRELFAASAASLRVITLVSIGVTTMCSAGRIGKGGRKTRAPGLFLGVFIILDIIPGFLTFKKGRNVRIGCGERLEREKPTHWGETWEGRKCVEFSAQINKILAVLIAVGVRLPLLQEKEQR